MRVEWNLFGFHLQKVVFPFIILPLHFHGFFSLNPEGFLLLAFRSKIKIDPFEALQNWDAKDEDPCNWNGVQCVDGRVEALNLQGLKLGGTLTTEIGKLGHLKALVLSVNNFTGTIPNEFGGLLMLELLDLRSNHLSGSIPLELGYLPSLKCLLLCENKFEAGTHSWMEKINMKFQQKNNKNLPCVNTKFGLWSKLKNKYLQWHGDKIGSNFCTATSYISQPVHDLHIVRRNLLQESKNLPSAPASSASLHAVSVPSHGSGSFAAIPYSKGASSKKAPPFAYPSSVPVEPDTMEQENWKKWIFTVIIPITVSIIIVIMAFIGVYIRNVTVIYAWRTGLSGPLRNAFITGVPKLNRAELEAACEDFSNIIITYPNSTVFKGILSSGVEIAVVSTIATSKFDWSEKSDSLFRNKIDTISRINHKNFVNLLGYCQEDDPFMRMMVFEYSSNGTLFEHLHVKEFEHLDWSTRMRIIMGIAYCLQYMHDLKPAVVHPFLQSSCIFITDDYAAKIADLGIFSEPVGKENDFLNENKDNFAAAPTSHPASNVYSFGILLLEIISGRMPISEDNGLPISNWAMRHLKDKKSINSLIDPSLTFNKYNELQIICEVAEACIHEDPKSRPTMKEVSSSLKEVLAIEPEAAMPRLSPLWWAELEILSVEAS
ncbi:LOW QUALITY PROTEIN: protein MALE DISCOVERER 1-like [Phalaenopsis equestris]|uniref:LOW QUALITY PROTEIN: protein MALE DISCOVERER 1-like n=1 Tax=Phalaenopsis equestris TaxID=78828 RepID=UPI0009E5FF8F|nr:LOW QUALITY PROTEIN: protein MALE DISCOVERER 1-like [Phalaenopsis equestris]